MSNDVTQIVSFLSQPQLAVPEGLKKDLHKVIPSLLSPELNSKTRKILVKHLKAGRNTKDAYKAILIESMLLYLEGKPVSSMKLKALLENYVPTLADGASVLATLNWWRFSQKEGTDERLKQHLGRNTFTTVFNRTVDVVDAMYLQVCGGALPAFKRTGNVIVLTRQMLMPPHAPSVRTLEFAKNLTENHGKNVMIVCSSETTSEPTGPLVPQGIGQFAEQFLTASTVNYEGVQLPFIMTGRGTFTEPAVRQTLEVMHNFDPEMILSIGAPNMLAEPFGDRAFCFFYMSGRGTAITRRQHFHTWDTLTDEQRSELEAEGTLHKHLFVSTPGYHEKVQYSKLTRSQFGVPDDAFLYCVIGLRLGQEVDTEFLTLLKRIAENSNSYFLFAGKFDGYEETMADWPELSNRCHFAGMQPDIMAVYELCDAFINPDRAGGGSGAAQALQGHVPVLTRPIGDVGYMVKNAATYETYEAMGDAAIAIANDRALHDTFIENAKKDGDRLSVRDEYLSRIMDEFEKFAEANE